MVTPRSPRSAIPLSRLKGIFSLRSISLASGRMFFSLNSRAIFRNKTCSFVRRKSIFKSSRLSCRQISFQRSPARTAEPEIIRNAFRIAGRTGLGVRAPEKFTGSSRGRALSETDDIHRALLHKSLHPFVRFDGAIVQGQPVSGMTNRGRPGKLFPEIHLFLRITSAFGELVDQLLTQGCHGTIEIFVRHHLIHKTPLQGLPGFHPFIDKTHLPGPAISDQYRQPLRGATSGNTPDAGTDLPDLGVLGGDGKIAGQMQLVSAPDDHTVNARYGGLSPGPEKRPDPIKIGKPLPVVSRAGEYGGRVFTYVPAGAKGLFSDRRQN